MVQESWSSVAGELVRWCRTVSQVVQERGSGGAVEDVLRRLDDVPCDVLQVRSAASPGCQECRVAGQMSLRLVFQAGACVGACQSLLSLPESAELAGVC